MTKLTGQQIADQVPAGWVDLVGGLQTLDPDGVVCLCTWQQRDRNE